MRHLKTTWKWAACFRLGLRPAAMRAAGQTRPTRSWVRKSAKAPAKGRSSTHSTDWKHRRVVHGQLMAFWLMKREEDCGSLAAGPEDCDNTD